MLKYLRLNVILTDDLSLLGTTLDKLLSGTKVSKKKPTVKELNDFYITKKSHTSINLSYSEITKPAYSHLSGDLYSEDGTLELNIKVCPLRSYDVALIVTIYSDFDLLSLNFKSTIISKVVIKDRNGRIVSERNHEKNITPYTMKAYVFTSALVTLKWKSTYFRKIARSVPNEISNVTRKFKVLRSHY